MVLATALTNANAQYVSLSNTEFGRLKQLLGTDATAKVAFEPFQNTANSAMNEAPNPIERITSEGKLAGDPDKIKSLKAVEDGDKIYAMALVYKLYGNKTFLDKTAEYLQAWAKINRSTGDPIDETKLESLITGYDMVRDDVGPQVRKAVDSWLEDVADGEVNSRYAVPGKGTANNNWNSHRIKVITIIAYTIHSEKYYKLAQQLLERQIGINLFADGSGYDFQERDALHYHIYTLEPLITAASVIYRATGKDFFNFESDKGSSIKKSVDFLVPFVTSEKTHGEFLNSKTAFDRARAKNNEKEYLPGSKFNPANGIHVLEQAMYFSSKYAPAVQQAIAASPQHSHDWELILDKVRKPSGLN